ncbi:hypothetical protein NKH18_47190 [Streptomyces sp. M10(2022)]
MSGDPTFAELVSRARDVGRAVSAHQDLPFERLVAELDPPRDPARHPSSRSWWCRGPTRVWLAPSSRAWPPRPARWTSKRPLDLIVELAERYNADGAALGIDVSMTYAVDLFDGESIVALTDRLVRFLTAALANSDRRVSRLEVLSDSEYKTLLVDWNGAPLRTRPAC